MMQQEPWEVFADFEFFRAIRMVFSNNVGDALTALMLFGSIGIALYIFSDDISLPVALTIILGPVFVSQLPAGPVQVVAIAVIIAIMGAGYMASRRFDHA